MNHLKDWLLAANKETTSNTDYQKERKQNQQTITLDVKIDVWEKLNNQAADDICNKLTKLIETWLSLQGVSKPKHIFMSHRMTRKLIYYCLIELDSPTGHPTSWPPSDQYWNRTHIIDLGNWMEQNLKEFYLKAYTKRDVIHHWWNRQKLEAEWDTDLA